MSSTRIGKWADADESEDEEEVVTTGNKAPVFETKADDQGIRLIIDYKERDGKTYKVTKRVRQTKVASWTNQKILERKDMKKFGKPALADPASEAIHIVRSEESIMLELSKTKAVNVTVKDEAEESFYEESLNIAEGLNKVKKSWTDMNRDKQVGRDDTGADRPAEPDKGSELRESAAAAVAASAASAGPGGPRAYVPPSLRGGGKDGDGKGKGKGFDPAAHQESSLRVTNLSEFAKEGDLQDLFSSVGRLQRTYLAKDDMGLSRGFAFVTYYTREDALKAIDKLNGYGYDNLILQVQFAKPRV